MTDPIEDLIHGLPLKSVSQSCDQKILATIRMPHGPNDIDDERESSAATKPSELSANSVAKKTLDLGNRRSKFASIAVSIAASLLIGFFVGMQFNGSRNSNRIEVVDGQRNSATANSNFGTNTSASTDDSMGINPSGINKIELIENESETFIVSESLHWKNQLPIRRVETVMNKKVLVTDNDSEPKRIEVPIRKVIYTLADSI